MAIVTPLSLLERLRTEPDEPSWVRLANLYAPLIRQWLGRSGVSYDDAEDLTQEIMIVLVRDVPGFDHSGRQGAFRCWLRIIVEHRVRDYWRRQRRNGTTLGPEHDLEDVEDRTDALARLWDQEHDTLVLRRLMELIEPEFAPATWHAFRRQVLDGQSAGEAATELGVTANAVLIAKSRVLRRLRQEAQGLTG